MVRLLVVAVIVSCFVLAWMGQLAQIGFGLIWLTAGFFLGLEL